MLEASVNVAFEAMLVAYAVFAGVTALVAFLVWFIGKLIAGRGEK